MNEAELLAASSPAPSPGAAASSDAPNADGNAWKNLYKHFEIAPGDPSADGAFQKIWDFALTKANSADRDEVMWEVIRLGHEIGSARMGEKPYGRMSAYVDVMGQMRQAEDRLKEFTRNKRA